MNATSRELLIPTLCGLIAPVWFLAALLTFGAIRADYSHATKAVSELGSVGAPNAIAWNIFGFGAVGILVMIFAWGLGRQSGSMLAALTVGASGLGFAAASIPADLSDFDSMLTRLHIFASLVSFASFAAAVIVVGLVLHRRMGLRGLALLTTAWGIAAILSVLLRETNIPPGIAQRINFMAYLIWVAMVAAGTRKTPTFHRA